MCMDDNNENTTQTGISENNSNINEINEKNDDSTKKECEKCNEKKHKKSLFRKIVGTFFRTIIYILVIGAFIFGIRALAFHKYDVFGYRFFVIMSGSMEPTIHAGDAVITKEVSEVHENDIIAFAQGEYTTVHRVINLHQEGDNISYKTKGDNNNAADFEKIQLKDIKGIVVKRVPGVGNVILYLRNHIIYVIFGIVVILLAIIVRRLLKNG